MTTPAVTVCECCGLRVPDVPHGVPVIDVDGQRTGWMCADCVHAGEDQVKRLLGQGVSFAEVSKRSGVGLLQVQRIAERASVDPVCQYGDCTAPAQIDVYCGWHFRRLRNEHIQSRNNYRGD